MNGAPSLLGVGGREPFIPMSTELSIANRALRRVGGTPLTSLEGDSGIAKVMREALTSSIEEVLSLFNWPITRRVLELSPSVEWSPGHSLYANAFELPADVSRMTGVTDTDGYPISDYKLENNHILADEDTVLVHYSKLPESPDNFPAYLNTLIAAHLAYACCITITGADTRYNQLRDEFERELRRAKVTASREGPPISHMPDSSSGFIEAHQSYGDV